MVLSARAVDLHEYRLKPINAQVRVIKRVTGKDPSAIMDDNSHVGQV